MKKFGAFWKAALPALLLLLVSSNLEAKSSKRKPARATPHQVQEVKKDTNKLAQDGVNACYNAHAQNYDMRVAQEKERLISMNAGNSSYSRLIPIQVAKEFATAIINQLTSLTQTLSYQEKNDFWDASEQHVKVVLDGFCKRHGSQSTGDLNAHIAGQINMKKIFGR